jgi:hypothetical protein
MLIVTLYKEKGSKKSKKFTYDQNFCYSDKPMSIFLKNGEKTMDASMDGLPKKSKIDGTPTIEVDAIAPSPDEYDSFIKK